MDMNHALQLSIYNQSLSIETWYNTLDTKESFIHHLPAMFLTYPSWSLFGYQAYSVVIGLCIVFMTFICFK